MSELQAVTASPVREIARAVSLPHETVICDSTANPAPLGLMGFGLTTILLNMHNAGFIGIGSMILAMGLFYGGVAQVMAGYMEWKKKNTFGMVAFTSYGFFWISLVALVLMPKFGVEAADSSAMAAYLFVWGLFILVTLLFFLLAVADATGNKAITRLAGYEGILCGLGAMYVGAAQIWNEMYGRTVLPL